MTSNPTVYVVTPVHNRWRYTGPFLKCLSQQTWSQLTIVIVDDGSTDGTSEHIRTRFPRVVLLRGDGNLWWTASVNTGIRWVLERASPSDYVLVMNDDLEVDPPFVERLLRFALQHPRGLIGAPTVAIEGDGRIEDGGVLLNLWTAKLRLLNHGSSIRDFPPGHFERPSYLTGRACLIPVEAFRQVGLYDEAHFLNCGDTELPVRARKRGYDLFICYDAVVRSHVEAVAPENLNRNYSLGTLREYFFGVKSYARLNYRFSFARTAAGPNPLRFVSYLTFDLLRLTVHFVRGLRR